MNNVLLRARKVPATWILYLITAIYAQSPPYSFELEIPANRKIPAFTSLVQKYVRPYIKKFEHYDNMIYKTGAQELAGISDMASAIEEKIMSLTAFLDDDTQNSPKSLKTFGDYEEDFVPEKMLRSPMYLDPMKERIHTYKKLRNKVNNALKIETVTNKTKVLIMTTIDSMVRQMVDHQCIDPRKSTREKTVSKLMNSWSDMWLKIKDKYNDMLRTGNDKHLFIKKLDNFFSHIYEDVKSLSQKYKVTCEFENADEKIKAQVPFFGFGTQFDNNLFHSRVDGTKTSKENTDTKVDQKVCRNFRLCYTELKDFMIDLYYNLNDTVVSLVSDYGAMYERDVNNDSMHEKENVIGLLRGSSSGCEQRMRKVFKKELHKFKLDPNKDRHKNIKVIYVFISNLMNYTKLHVNDILEQYLKTVRRKLVNTIKKDLAVNMNLELGNLERDVTEKLCTIFETCNGKYVTSRRSFSADNINKGVYVNLHISLDEEGTDNIISDQGALNGRRRFVEYSSSGAETKSTPRVEVTRTVPLIQRLILQEKMKLDEMKNGSHVETVTVNTRNTTPVMVFYKK